MPLYEYVCERCGGRFDALVAASADAPACPSCGAVRVRREISVFATPGSGGSVATSGCGCGGACACGGR